MSSCSKNKNGFTLIEVLITTIIFIMILIAAYYFQIRIYQYNDIITSNLNTQQQARKILRPFAEEVRASDTSNSGDYAISRATVTLLEFYSDIDNDGLFEKVRYFREENTFKKGVIEPTGDPLNYDSANEEIVGVVENIVNDSEPVFEYFDGTYDGISNITPLSYPIDVSNVKLVKITLMVDDNPNIEPGPIEMSTQATFRNLRNN